jgi:hypothetical protein
MPPLKPAVAKANRAKASHAYQYEMCPGCRHKRLRVIRVRLCHVERSVTALLRCDACHHVVFRIAHTGTRKRVGTAG